MSVRADAETLRRIPIFQRCDPVALQILAFSSERMSVGIRDRILTEGKASDAAHLVLNGSFSILAGGREIGQAGPGILLGETAMIGGTLPTITAEARELSYVARISYEMFLKVAREYPDFGQAVLSELSSRLTSALQDFDMVREKLLSAGNMSGLKLR
jgi:CRP-like cAMP-binding protein